MKYLFLRLQSLSKMEEHWRPWNAPSDHIPDIGVTWIPDTWFNRAIWGGSGEKRGSTVETVPHTPFSEPRQGLAWKPNRQEGIDLWPHRCLLCCEHRTDGGLCVKLYWYYLNHEPTTPSGARPKKVIFWCWEEKSWLLKSYWGGLDCIEIPVSVYWCCLQPWCGRNHQGHRHTVSKGVQNNTNRETSCHRRAHKKGWAVISEQTWRLESSEVKAEDRWQLNWAGGFGAQEDYCIGNMGSTWTCLFLKTHF